MRALLAPLVVLVGLSVSPSAAAASTSHCDGYLSSALFAAYDCGSFTVTHTGGACTRSGSGTSETISCAAATYTASIAAYNWAEDGSFGTYSIQLDSGCSGPSSESASWSGSLLSPGFAQRSFTVTCPDFSYGWGECFSKGFAVWIGYDRGADWAFDLSGGDGVGGDCIP